MGRFGRNCFFRAMAHQFKLTNHEWSSKEFLFYDLRTDLHKKDDNGVWRDNEDIQAFAKKHNCIIAIVTHEHMWSKDRQICDYVYHFYDRGEYKVLKASDPEFKLPENQTVYKLARKANHFMSVVTDPKTDVKAPVLPSIFDLIPHYRQLKAQRVPNQSPRHLLKRFVRVIPQGRSSYEILMRAAKPVISVFDDTMNTPVLTRDEHNFLGAEYQNAQRGYYQTYFDHEKDFQEKVLEEFIVTIKKLFAEPRGLAISMKDLMQVVDKLKWTEWGEMLEIALTHVPDALYIAYYAHARKLVLKQGSKERVRLMLEKAKEYLADPASSWRLISMWTQPQAGTVLEKQIIGRLCYEGQLTQNIETNISAIDTCKSGNIITVGSFVPFEFEKMGVLPEDESAIKTNGVPAMYALQETMPKPEWYDIAGMVVLGIGQAIVGGLLTATGIGGSIGFSLLSDGIQDLWQGMKSGWMGTAIDWGSYWLNKGFSALMMVAGSAWSKLTAGTTASQQAVKEATKEATKEITKEGVKLAAKEVTQATATDLIISTVKSAALNIVLSEGLEYLRSKAIASFQKEMQEKAMEYICPLFEEEDFKAALNQLLVFNSGTEGRYKFQANIREHMDSWIKNNSTTCLASISNILSTLQGARRSELLSFLEMVTYGATTAYNLASTLDFLKNYTKELKQLIIRKASELHALEKIAMDVSGLSKEKVSKWIECLQGPGLFKSTHSYTIETVVGDLNAEKALSAILTATESLGIHGESAKGHPLTKLAQRLIEAAVCAHQNGLAKEESIWVQLASGALEGKINSGIGMQAQQLGSKFIKWGASALSSLREQDRKEVLMAKGDSLTSEEAQELRDIEHRGVAHLQAELDVGGELSADDIKKLGRHKALEQAVIITRMQHLNDKHRMGDWTPADKKALEGLNSRDYSRLKSEHDAGLSLTPEETMRLDGYEAQIAADNARKAEQQQRLTETPEEKARRQQAIVDGIKADAERDIAKGRANEAAIVAQRALEEAQRQREAAARQAAAESRKKDQDPTPGPALGTLPAVASGKAPANLEALDSMGLVQFLRQQEEVKKRLATMFAPAQLHGIVEAAKPMDLRQSAAAKMESEIQRLEGLAKERPLTFMEHEGLACARELITDQRATNISHKELIGVAIGLAMAPEIVAAPLVAGASIALSVGANYAGKKVAIACGADQTTAENVGMIVAIIAGGAVGFVRAPIVTAVETVLAVGTERGTEAALLAAGCSREAASDIAAVVGAWTPLMTGGRVGALADRAVITTGRTLRTAGSRVVSEVSRLDVRVDRLTAGTAFGNVSVGVKPRASAVRSTSAPHVAWTVPAANSAAAEWRQPMEVAQRSVQMTAPSAAAEAPQTRGRPTTERPVQPRASSVPRPSGAREMVEPSFSEARLNGAANRLTTEIVVSELKPLTGANNVSFRKVSKASFDSAAQTVPQRNYSRAQAHLLQGKPLTVVRC